ncbi:hypothetical protein LOAG_08317 [Loa loa]|uniref:Uncharacterized protein n=1 Tax=Loa loa TaxID=7209 RepID=A0A1S0TTZ6_LOALO|nr:hypothetical protein LOAG_08317 [Loa loa]EFO20175.1 hypothetical protein LOAG_08317 [Loa loa]
MLTTDASQPFSHYSKGRYGYDLSALGCYDNTTPYGDNYNRFSTTIPTTIKLAFIILIATKIVLQLHMELPKFTTLQLYTTYFNYDNFISILPAAAIMTSDG